MNCLVVLFVIFGLGLDYGYGSDESSSSSSEDVNVYTPEEAALLEQLFFFIDGFEGFIAGTQDNFFESGEYFTDDAIFCTTASGCAKSLAEMPSLFGVFQALVDELRYTNLEIIGVTPSLAIPSVTFIADESAIIAATGCSFTAPSRTRIIYFEGELVSQYHIADTDEQSVLAFFEGLQSNATSCN